MNRFEMKKKIILSLAVIIISVAAILGIKYIEKSNLLANENKNIELKTQKDNKEKIKDKETEDKVSKEKNNKDNGKEIRKNTNKISKDYSKTESNKELSKKTINNNSQNKSNKSVKNNTTIKSNEIKNTKKSNEISAPNVIIMDETTGKVFKNIYIDFTSNPTVSEVTLEATGGNSRVTGSGESTYFQAMFGIAERQRGPLSGWCYYINGTKASKGAGSYRLKTGDKLTWKFVQDGVNN